MSWTLETSSLASQVRDHLARFNDQQARTQTAAWANAWDEIAPDLEAALNELALQAVDGRIRRADVIRSRRLLNALDLIQERLAGLVDESGRQVIDQLREVVDYAGSMQERLTVSQMPPGAAADVAAWSRVSADAVDAIVLRSTEKITKASYPISDEAAAVMRRQLVRGIAVGENPRAVAATMVRRTERGFNGGLSRALTIARTEMLDAHRAAAALSDRQNADVLDGWVWTASLGARTCPACWGMHGTVLPLEQPGPEGHQNCRCTRVPKPKPWSDLGFDINEPDDLMPDAGDLFDALTPEQQRDILGPSRYNAWTKGRYPMSDWATRRENPGWRDSWVPSKAPAA